MKICIFPNDPLLSYYKKGEIKNRYFNPLDFFDEVHVISLFDNEIESDKVRKLAGKGSLFIHKLGKANLSNYKSFEKKIVSCVKEINPEIIRTFNGLVIGWLAVKVGKKLDIPVVVSLHTNYEQQRKESREKGKLLTFIKLQFVAKKIEKYVMKNADAVICVYNFIVPYAKKLHAKNIHVIYNKVDLSVFSPDINPVMKSSKPIILSVGRLIDQKDHKLLVSAIKDLDVKLIIIGDGPNYDSILNLAKSLRISDKIEIIKQIPNEKLNEYYTLAKIYAQPLINLEGVPIPVFEAMASGLPIVMSKHSKNYSEIIDDTVFFVENDGKEFKIAFKEILANNNLSKDLKTKSLNTIKKISGEKMEDAEVEVYKKLF